MDLSTSTLTEFNRKVMKISISGILLGSDKIQVKQVKVQDKTPFQL